MRPISKVIMGVLVLAAIGSMFYFLRGKNTIDNLDNASQPANFPVNTSVYADPDGRFAFNYPNNLKAKDPVSNPGSSSTNILFESAEPNSGFQLTVTPFDEEGPITPDRIRQDLPDIVMSEIATVKIDEVDATAFNSVDSGASETYEVWFAKSGYLYQFMAYRSFADNLKTILETWKFK